MVASKCDGTKDYKISVIGDLNGDGLLNQIDLGILIKNILGIEEVSLTGILFKSGDIKYDNNINQIDLSAVITYILFGRLDNDFPREEKINKFQINSFEVKEKTIKTIEVCVNVESDLELNENVPYTYLISENESFSNAKTIYSKLNDYIFKDLKPNTTYYIKVIVENIEGEKLENIIKVKTEKIPEVGEKTTGGTTLFDVTDIIWENEKASKKLKNKTD